MKLENRSLSKGETILFVVTVILSFTTIIALILSLWRTYTAFYALAIANTLCSFINVTRPLGERIRAKRVVAMFFVSVLILMLPKVLNVVLIMIGVVILSQSGNA